MIHSTITFCKINNYVFLNKFSILQYQILKAKIVSVLGFYIDKIKYVLKTYKRSLYLKIFYIGYTELFSEEIFVL